MRGPRVIGVSFLALVVAATVGLGALGPAGSGPEAAAEEKAMLGPGDFDYTRIDVPASLRTWVFGINADGNFVGRYMLSSGVQRGFVSDGVTYEDVIYPGAVTTTAFGINARGDIAGTFVDAGARSHGYVLLDGQYTEIVIEGSTQVVVYDINASGAVLGRYTDADGNYVNFLWHAGVVTELPISGVEWAEGYGLNDRGQVAGHFVAAGDATGHMSGFVYDRGEFTALQWPEANMMSCLQGIGDTGEAVGHVQQGAFVFGYMWRSGRYTATLAVPGASQTYPHGLSPSGVIAGYFVDAATRLPHGFIARARR